LEQIKSKLLATKPGVSATKQKVAVIAVPVLFIVLIFVFVRAFSSPSRKITGAGTPRLVKAVATADTKVEWKVPEPYPTTLRDPMQFGPATTQTGQAGGTGLVVKGIVYSKNNPCAIIGDQMVHEGDEVLGVVIVKINEDSVEFGVNGKRWTQRVQR
jgi:type II secretory pathway component PulC